MAATIIDRNGTDVPEDLRALPAGRYVVHRLEDLPALTPDEERGLVEALDSLREQREVPHEQVRARVLKRLGA